MKLILIPLLLLLTSCSQYRYDVTYEKCNGQTGSVQSYHQYVWQVPQLYDTVLSALDFRIGNVCDFSFTRNEIK